MCRKKGGWAEIGDTAEPLDCRLVLDSSARYYGGCIFIFALSHNFCGETHAVTFAPWRGRGSTEVVQKGHSCLCHSDNTRSFFLLRKRTQHALGVCLSSKQKNGRIIANNSTCVPHPHTMPKKDARGKWERQKWWNRVSSWKRKGETLLKNCLPAYTVMFRSLRWWWRTQWRTLYEGAVGQENTERIPVEEFPCPKTQTQHKVGLWLQPTSGSLAGPWERYTEMLAATPTFWQVHKYRGRGGGSLSMTKSHNALAIRQRVPNYCLVGPCLSSAAIFVWQIFPQQPLM